MQSLELLIIFIAIFLLFLFVILFVCKSLELHKILRRNQNSNEQKEDYMAMMIHDIRTPLSVIRGAADILLVEDKNLQQEDKEKLLNQIKETSEELLKMAGNILDVSKIEMGRFEIHKVKADLNMILKGEHDYFLPLVNKNGLKMEIKLDPGISKVDLDPDQLKRVLNNLISNAIKFTPSGGSILISSKKFNSSSIEVCVADTGIGIKDSIKKKLFNKFIQGDQTEKSAGTGYGLGLVVVKEIVSLHGGKIRIEDNIPKGTRFIFTLPL